MESVCSGGIVGIGHCSIRRGVCIGGHGLALALLFLQSSTGE